MCKVGLDSIERQCWRNLRSEPDMLQDLVYSMEWSFRWSEVVWTLT
jgi:hypothetical protein